ncbi:MAG: hypothetical protein JKY95_04760 [Planctomycetaceae bacterium]|nr:hypothetical protein [Planctomycetaceae bacterium]
MSYPAALNLYGDLCRDRPNLIKKINQSIDNHVVNLSSVRSDQAGARILPSHPDFAAFCDEMAAQVFGIVMREHLIGQNWTKTLVTENGKKVNYYNR